MSYRVEFRPSAVRDFKALSSDCKPRIETALSALGAAPRGPGCRKLAGGGAAHRLRVGDYRILYEIDDPDRRVLVFRIAHRREAYR